MLVGSLVLHVCIGGGVGELGAGRGRTEETRRAREIVCCAFVMIALGRRER